LRTVILAQHSEVVILAQPESLYFVLAAACSLSIAIDIHSSLQVEPRLVHDIHEYLMK
jgi:hypothetical protein